MKVTSTKVTTSTRFYLIRLRKPLRWAYVKTTSNSKEAFRKAESQFGKDLAAFEPSPHPRKKRNDNYEVFNLDTR